MKRGFVRILTVTAAMVSMLSVGMTASAAESYTVAEGDHLMKIAQEKYGDETKWDVIFEANKEAIKEPTKIYPGQVLVIPDLTTQIPVQLPAVTAVQPEAAPAPAAAAVQPETAPAPAAAAAQPETAPAPAAAAVQPETAPAPAAAAVQPETAPVPAAAVTQPETAPAPAAAAAQPVVAPVTTQTPMTLEDYYKDPEFKRELDAEMSMFSEIDGMELVVGFQGNTMIVIVKITDSSYIVDGIGEALNQSMEQVGPVIEELIALIESELGNPGNCAVIYSYQTADGRMLAQRAFTAK